MIEYAKLFTMNKISHDAVLQIAALLLSRRSEHSEIIGFLLDEQTTATEVLRLETILQSEPLVLALYYGELGRTFKTQHEMQMNAQSDLGRITAMTARVHSRGMFMRYCENRYATKPQMRTQDFSLLAKYLNKPYTAAFEERVSPLLEESESTTDFWNKVQETFFPEPNRKELMRNVFFVLLLKKLQEPVDTEALAVFAIGYINQLHILNQNHGRRSKEQLEKELSEILALVRRWHYFGLHYDEKLFRAIMIKFFMNNRQVLEDAHRSYICRLILDYRKKSGTNELRQRINRYARVMKVSIVLDEDRFAEVMPQLARNNVPSNTLFEVLGSMFALTI